jgi:imidazolonepropionase-like amidohydrolase
MKWNIFTFIVCAILSIKIAIATETRPVASILIKNVSVVSAHLNRPSKNRDVLILDDRILDVVETGTDYPANKIIDAKGKFLIPGLIDSHVHLGHNPIINRNDQQEYERLHNEYRRQLPRSFLYHGFTSVVDLDYAPDRSRWLPETDNAPAVYHCGRGVRIAGGYGPAFVPQEFAHKAFPNMVYEARHIAKWPKELNPELYSVDAAVQRVVNSGAICLKTYVESGFGGIFHWPNPSPKTLTSLSEAAHKNGLVVVVHATSAEDWKQAIAGGADVIAHGLWHWQGDRRNSELTRESLSAIASAKNSGVAVQPTIQVVKGEKSTLTWDLMSNSGIAEVLTPGVTDYLRSDKGRWSQQELMDMYQKYNPYPDTSPSTLINASIRRATNSMLKLHRSGGSLLLGTDTPSQDGIGNPPGLNGFMEMKNWAQAGIPLDHIFRSATLDNARTFNLDHDLGSIEPGKQADLLLLNTNPLESVNAYDDISIVIVDGRAINRHELSARKLDTSLTP